MLFALKITAAVLQIGNAVCTAVLQIGSALLRYLPNCHIGSILEKKSNKNVILSEH
jgi:hypothetical protein